MKKFISCLIFIISFTTAQLKAQEITLTKRSYAIKVVEINVKGVQKSLPLDILNFYENKISANFSNKNGFAAAVCKVNKDELKKLGEIPFTAECESSNKDILKWSGKIINNSITGKAVRVRNGKPAGEYTFTGNQNKL